MAALLDEISRAALPGDGQSCATGLVLKPRCLAYHPCVEKTCRALAGAGESCVASNVCYISYCADEGACAPSACKL
ncbi:MAG: hypothetical protein MUF54_21175 [Polyangiaceae bacterium]|jgi:hypothetical protein|nr:hypothetical protein [Polyangiaceae bacterium]